jgi:hypothetical protein
MDGILPCVDAVKTYPRVKLHQWGKTVKAGGRGCPDDESGRTDEMDVQTVIFT